MCLNSRLIVNPKHKSNPTHLMHKIPAKCRYCIECLKEKKRNWLTRLTIELEKNPNAKKLLEDKGIWKEEYHSKTIDKVIDNAYDLVVTVCDHANETCPMFPKAVKVIHVGFEDPDGKGFDAFEATYKEIEEVLLPKVVEVLIS